MREREPGKKGYALQHSQKMDVYITFCLGGHWLIPFLTLLFSSGGRGLLHGGGGRRRGGCGWICGCGLNSGGCHRRDMDSGTCVGLLAVGGLGVRGCRSGCGDGGGGGWDGRVWCSGAGNCV